MLIQISDFIHPEIGMMRSSSIGTLKTIQKLMHVDISYEIFEVLDFDGEDCGHYHLTGETRDDCVKNHMKNQTLEKVGCFTPFFGDKSNICCSETESKRALEIYNDLIDKAWTGQIKECPKPCKFLMINSMCG